MEAVAVCRCADTNLPVIVKFRMEIGKQKLGRMKLHVANNAQQQRGVTNK
jgi:hypothetical protein